MRRQGHMTTPSRLQVLYITYDGLLEPLGQSQVLAYMEKLTPECSVHILSFEKNKDRDDEARMAAMRERLRAAGIGWTPLAYHKSPSVPATAYDVAVGTLVALSIVIRKKVKIVHARSYVPALVALALKRAAGVRFIFDMRGFWADERVDGGLWPKNGRLYRIAKNLERHFLEEADHVVTLTNAGAREIAQFLYLKHRMPPVSVIPTCADLNLFRPGPGHDDNAFTFGYVGSVGTWYLFDEILAFFRTIAERRRDARLLVVNRNEHEMIRTAVQRAGIEMARVEIAAVEHRDVPKYIVRMRVAAAIYMPTYSKIATAPTKLAEYLGCGVPCVGNVGVGDMQEILEGKRVGVALRGFTPVEYDCAVDRMFSLLREPNIGKRCVETAREHFSLEMGVDAYRNIYLSLEVPDLSARIHDKPDLNRHRQ
jgi:glycosyltransferase involved in cell wall biosynthesis